MAQLMPEWSLSSVQYVREVADQGLCTPNCVFYRAEPGFLLQVSAARRLGVYVCDELRLA